MEGEKILISVAHKMMNPKQILGVQSKHKNGKTSRRKLEEKEFLHSLTSEKFLAWAINWRYVAEIKFTHA